MIIRVPWNIDTSGRRVRREPSLPEGAILGRVIKDHGDEVTVELHPDSAWPPRTYKSDIWRRTTDTEAEAISALIDAQPIRLQRMWQDISYLDHNDELFGFVQSELAQAVGEERAGELLAPSDVS